MWRCFIIVGMLCATSVLGGCGSTNEADGPSMTRVSFSDETDMYRVEIEQEERNGQCLRRRMLFTSHSRLYTNPHVDRVRAIDNDCDATDTSDFEEFEILRSPEQLDRYERSFSFRTRVNEDLWEAYQTALFNAEVKRRRADRS